MNQLTQLFRNFSWRQRIWLAVVAVGVIGGLASLQHWNQERDFAPLFTGLAAEDAGALLSKLHESGVEYRLTDNGSTVLVASGRVAELRIQMASVGLPKSGRIGFELFDKANFGASDFAEQVNYHRAIEGELEHSVMSIREVEQARVHVTFAKESLYTEARQPAKASVLVKLRSAAPLSPQNVAAICQLTASAVPGLGADQVSVIDSNGNLLNHPRRHGTGDANDASDNALEYRNGIEHDLQNRIAATLEPLLGADHFRVGVSADVDLTSSEQSEEVFDPQKSVMATSQRTDDGPNLAAASGVPGTASNLPAPASSVVTGNSNYARHTESITYQTSRLVKHTVLPQGSVKKLSLSVLVDHVVRLENGKRLVEPPSPEKLKVIHDLVAAATGLNAARGDQLVVEALPFESTLTPESTSFSPIPIAAPPAPFLTLPPWLDKLVQKNPRIMGGIGAGIVVLTIAALVMWRRLRKDRDAPPVDVAHALDPAKPRSIAAAEGPQRNLEQRLTDQTAEIQRQETEALLALKGPEATTKRTEVLSKHIAAETKQNPGAMAQVVRTWLNG